MGNVIMVPFVFLGDVVPVAESESELKESVQK